jgi:hypothetical protein
MNEPEFDKALERGFAGMRARRGPCPVAGRLAGFASRELPADEAASIREHVAVCGACDAMLIRLRRFEEAKAGDFPVDAREERIRARVFPRWRAGKWVAGMAGYAAAAGVLVCWYLGFLPARSVERAAPSWEAVETIDLNRVRGDATPPSGRASSQYVILSFFVDIRPDLPYEAVLDGGERKSVASYDRLGNFRLVVDRRLLGPGRHVLAVREANSRAVEFVFDMK